MFQYVGIESAGDFLRDLFCGSVRPGGTGYSEVRWGTGLLSAVHRAGFKSQNT